MKTAASAPSKGDSLHTKNLRESLTKLRIEYANLEEKARKYQKKLERRTSTVTSHPKVTKVETAIQTKTTMDKIKTLDSNKIETPDVEEVAHATATSDPPCTWVDCDDETMEKVILYLNEKALHRVELLEKVRNPE